MTKVELVAAIADETNITKKDAGAALDAIVGIITETLENGDEVRIAGLGTFSRKKRDARIARNPKTGEPVQVDETIVPKFHASATLKNALNA